MRTPHHATRAALVLVGVLASAPLQAAPARIASADGVKDLPGAKVRADIRFIVPEGADEGALADAARRALGLRPLGPFDADIAPFTLNGFQWPQFFDHKRRNNNVVQYYNPQDDPTGGAALQALLNTHTTWSSVAASSYRISFGGLTDVGPAFLDMVNVVVWAPLPESWFLAVTFSTYFVDTGDLIDSDIIMNTRIAPPEPPPPGGETPPPPPPPFPPLAWNTDGSDVDVETVLLHENGHVAGLGHTSDATAVMFPSYQGVVRSLGEDDIGGIIALYPLHPRTTITRPTRPATRSAFGVRTIAQLWSPFDDQFLINDFEPGTITDTGLVSFAADIPADQAGEGLFLERLGSRSVAVRSGDAAPGGGTFGAGILGRFAINQAGDGTFAYALEPFLLPIGLNAGVYRYADGSATLSAVVTPFKTPAPGGGVFVGAFGAQINNRGEIVFAGLTETAHGVTAPYGFGVYLARRDGSIVPVVAPGDAAPGGGRFDYAAAPDINDAGDIVFSGHVAGTPCLTPSDPAVQIVCFSGVYVKSARSGNIRLMLGVNSVVPAGTLRAATSGDINNRGDVLVVGDLSTAPSLNRQFGLFLVQGDTVTAIARPGDSAPGGGMMTTTSGGLPLSSLANNGRIAFGATLDTDVNSDGLPDTGVFVWSEGQLEVVARTGTEIPGVGVVDHLQPPTGVGFRRPLSGAVINDAGEVLFQVSVFDSIAPASYQGYLLVARPQ